MVVIRDEDYHSELATEKLQQAGFKLSTANRRPRLTSGKPID